MVDIWQAFDNYDRKTGFVIKTSNKLTYQDYERLNQEYLKLQSENERLCQIIDFHQRAFDVYYDEEDHTFVVGKHSFDMQNKDDVLLLCTALVQSQKELNDMLSLQHDLVELKKENKILNDDSALAKRNHQLQKKINRLEERLASSREKNQHLKNQNNIMRELKKLDIEHEKLLKINEDLKEENINLREQNKAQRKEYRDFIRDLKQTVKYINKLPE